AEAVEIVNFRVTAVGLIPKPPAKPFEKTAAPARPHEIRRVYFTVGDAGDVPVFRRRDLQPGMQIAGPAIIEEKTSTTVLYPDQNAEMDAYLNIEIEVATKPSQSTAPTRPSPR